MNRYSRKTQSCLTAFLSMVGTLLFFAIMGCAELRPYVKSLIATYDDQAGKTNSIVVPPVGD